MGSPTCLIRTRRSSATRRETPAGTVAPGWAPWVTDAGCARAAPATANKYRHSRIIEYVLRERREGPRPPAGFVLTDTSLRQRPPLAGVYKISADFGASHSWGRRCT